MISILIPVFNVHVYELVQELSNQLDNLSIEAEILVYDDFSIRALKSLNSSVSSIDHVVYKELEEEHMQFQLDWDKL